MSTATVDKIIGEFDKGSKYIADKTVGGVLKALDAWSDGRLNTATLHDVLLVQLTLANSMARGVADALASQIIAQLTGGEPPGVTGRAPAGLTPAGEAERLHQAITTILEAIDTADDVRTNLERIATAEPIGAMQDQMITSYAEHGFDGYRRGLEPGACELCEWLKKSHLDPDGFVYPADQAMFRHPGCRCTPIPARKE